MLKNNFFLHIWPSKATYLAFFHFCRFLYNFIKRVRKKWKYFHTFDLPKQHFAFIPFFRRFCIITLKKYCSLSFYVVFKLFSGHRRDPSACSRTSWLTRWANLGRRCINGEPEEDLPLLLKQRIKTVKK